MATRQLKLKKDSNAVSEWLNLARNRIEIPNQWLEVNYSKDADSLYIKLLNSPAAYSDDDLSESVIFDYDESNCLVGIEVLNLYGVFV